MKKIVVCALIAIATVVVQGASVAWSLEKDAAKTYGGNTVYVIDGGNIAAVSALLSAGGADVSTAFNAYVLGSAATNSRGAAEGTVANFSGDSLAFVVFSGGTVADGGTYDITAAVAASAYSFEPPANAPGQLPITVDTFTSKGNTIGGATPGPEGVPEPTSGLLLLVGGALLALRRKQK